MELIRSNARGGTVRSKCQTVRCCNCNLVSIGAAELILETDKDAGFVDVLIDDSVYV